MVMTISPTSSVTCTLVLPIRGSARKREVLLGLGAKGVSLGRRNGFGGKLEAGDLSVRERATIELQEESGLTAAPTDLIPAAVVTFRYPGEITGLGVASARDIRMYTYLVAKWQGQPISTPAMHDPHWFKTSDLPFAQMMPDAELWYPAALGGNRIEATITYQADSVGPATIREVPTWSEIF